MLEVPDDRFLYSGWAGSTNFNIRNLCHYGYESLIGVLIRNHIRKRIGLLDSSCYNAIVNGAGCQAFERNEGQTESWAKSIFNFLTMR